MVQEREREGKRGEEREEERDGAGKNCKERLAADWLDVEGKRGERA